jgi:outer membrane protein assembly factor BamA
LLLSGAEVLVAQFREEERPVVRAVSFQGNRAIDDLTLRISIATSQSSFVARHWATRWLGIGERRYFDQTEFRRDVLRVILLYRQSGYPRVHVDTIVRRSGGAVSVKFLITEGPPVRVRSLTVTGTEGIVAPRALIRDLPIAAGDPFNRFRFDAAADTIRNALRNRGYPFVEVFRRYDVNEDSLVADLAFDVVPGPRAVIERVIVEGTQQVGEEVVRRMIPLRAGALYRQSALYETQRDLYRLGLFNYANVTLVDSLPAGPRDTTVTVKVQVAEGALHRLRLGAGYGTVDCFRILGAWTAHDVLGGGRVLDLSARASKIGVGSPFAADLQNTPLCGALKRDEGTERLNLNYNVTASVREPYFFSRRMRAVLSLSAERHSEVQAFVREAVGGTFSLTRETRWDIPVTLSYSLSYGRTLAEPAIFCSFLLVCAVEDTLLFAERRLQGTLSAALVRDRSNSVLEPTRGNVLSAQLRYASRTIGSDELIQFTKASVEFASYHSLTRRTVFAWRVRAGTIVSPKVLVGGQEVRIVPPAERFYGGGPNSVRGFPQNLLGPVVYVVDTTRERTALVRDSHTGGEITVAGFDTLTAPTGGNQLFFANAELRFPLPLFSGRLGGALFVDGGQVVERDEARGERILSLRDFRVTPGAGVRIATPLGPVRLDLAYNPYGPQVGRLYRPEGRKLEKVYDQYPLPEAPVKLGFLDRLRIHLAVGHPF